MYCDLRLLASAVNNPGSMIARRLVIVRLASAPRPGVIFTQRRDYSNEIPRWLTRSCDCSSLVLANPLACVTMMEPYVPAMDGLPSAVSKQHQIGADSEEHRFPLSARGGNQGSEVKAGNK